ncbi:MAG: hypothetical protein H6728_02870 [Myxococcales bacterium]|nr:hypothetical protein [Myxococcales bacterium]MCB9641996.1 hypothetical protein [Myxococcales bacterium]
MDAFLFTVIIAGGIVLTVALLALVISLVESGGRRKRMRQLLELREGPSALRLPKPPPVPTRSVTPQLPALEIPLEAKAPPKRITPQPEAPLAVEEPPSAPPTMPDNTSEAGELLGMFGDQHDNSLSALTSPGQRLTPITSAVEPTLDEPRHDVGLPVSAPIPVSPQELGGDSKQILYLDPDFELAEVKRVLRIWQMTPATADNMPANQMGRWLCEDGTLVELLVGDKGYPYLDIRGPMAHDLARYLPQDLPIRPDLSNLSEMS